MNPPIDPIAYQDRVDLCQASLAVREHAYSVYSHFQVGAAILDFENRVFVGCNVENASFGLTMCAERAALFNAISCGSRQFKAMAVATSGAHLPCGACRQVLAEFQTDLLILLCDADQPNDINEVSLRDIFPGRFMLPG